MLLHKLHLELPGVQVWEEQKRVREYVDEAASVRTGTAELS